MYPITPVAHTHPTAKHTQTPVKKRSKHGLIVHSMARAAEWVWVL